MNMLMRKRDTFLPFSPPLIGEEEIEEVVDTLRSEWITTGPKTARFERTFSEYIGTSDALALGSCTAGLHTTLITLGIGSGHEVITTPMTFAASVNVIEHVNAKPVLVDVEPDTLNMDPEKLEAAMTPATKAIIAVHYGGHPVALDPIEQIARARGITVIEDAAHAVSAKYRGLPIGSNGNPVSFSFYATKNLTTSEGGMLTGTREFLDRARIVSLHGMNRDAWRRYDRAGSWYYEVVTPGFKYNMTDIQAAIGLCQLKKLDAFQRRRRQVVEAYNRAFSEMGVFDLPVERPEVEHAWHLYVLRIKPGTLTIGRDRFIEELTHRNIGSSVHFIPIHLHPYYRKKYGFKPTDFPVSYENYLRIFSLPLNPSLSDQDVADVVEAVADIVDTFRR